MKFDRSLFIAKFAEEAKEHLQKLGEGLLTLEKSPEDTETTKVILRSAHTLKGSSRMLKFDDIGIVAHRMEDLLIDIRDRKIAYRGEIFDLLFACVDQMEACLAHILAGGEGSLDVAGLAADIQRAQRGEPLQFLVPRARGAEGPSPAPAPPAPAASAAPAPPEAARAGTAAQAVPPEPPALRASDPMAALRDLAAPVTTRPSQRLPRPTRPLDGTTDAVRMEDTVRIGMGKLDRSIRLAGELVVGQMKSRERLGELAEVRRLARRYQQLTQRIGDMERDELGGISVEEMVDGASMLLARVDEMYKRNREDLALVDISVNDLQEHLLSMRMLPLSTILEPFPRHVRDLARELGKDVELVLEGEETELDKKILEKIGDAILHILRNAVDHGIERPSERRSAGKDPRGLVIIRAQHESGNIKIVLEDDGAGLDLEAIRRKAVARGLLREADRDTVTDHEVRGLIFMPDFSTAEIITDVSGRGVGLDVVKKRVEELKGALAVDSERGSYTKFTITLPLTLASLRVLFVTSGITRFAIPIDSVQETMKVRPDEVIQIVDRKAVRVRNQLVPLLDLAAVLQLPDRQFGRRPERGELFLVIAHSAGERIGIVVDAIEDEREMILKPLPAHLRKTPHVSGLTISGKNEIILVLHVPDLVASARRLKAVEKPRVVKTESERPAPLLLVVDDSLNTREIEKSILEAEGYRVDLAKDGLEALKKARERRYDLVVTDIEMPRLDGFSLTAQLREDKDYQDVPVVIVTSKEREEDKRRGIEVGANAYIVKGSFDQTNLIETVASLIG